MKNVILLLCILSNNFVKVDNECSGYSIYVYLYIHKNLVFISLFHFQTRYGKTDITCPIVLMNNYFIDKFSGIMH